MDSVNQGKRRTRAPIEEREWLSPQEVGELAGGLSAQFVRDEIKNGKLEAMVIPSNGDKKKRGRYRVRRSVAEAFAARILGLCSTCNTERP